ncbi:glutaredoxin [Mortierella sp. AM989]|nr:glutaredoxin [Mortierella sp. AM989]
MAAAIKTEVDNIIASHGVVVFSKTHCPYCKTAKSHLEKHGAKAHIVELDLVENGAAIQAYLLELTGQRTVPNIFIGQTHIGGCDKLLSLSDKDLNEKLAKL